jgi:hypothetical protein
MDRNSSQTSGSQHTDRQVPLTPQQAEPLVRAGYDAAQNTGKPWDSLDQSKKSEIINNGLSGFGG